MANITSDSHSSLTERDEKEPRSTVNPDHRSMAKSDLQPQRSREEWRPGFWAHFPWIGLCSLFMALLMSIISVVVLVVSDNKAASQWSNTIAPNVILNILNSIASFCFAVAVGRGIAITWWRKAAHGTTIQDLSRSWAFGYDSLSLLLQARHFNVVALAALVTKLTIVDGTLFQRATTTYVALGPQAQHNLTTFPTDAFPPTGIFAADPNTPKFLDSLFSTDVGTWIRSGDDKVDGTYGFNDCQGVCAVSYPGAGFAISCSSSTQEVDLLSNNFGGLATNTTASTTSISLFDLSFNFTEPTASKNYTWIGVNMTNYNTQDQTPGTLCPAQILSQQCEFRPAILNYPVVAESTNVVTKLQNGNQSQSSYVTVYLGQLNDTDGSWEGVGDFDPTINQVPGFEILSYVNVTDQAEAYGYTSIGGIMLAMQDFYTSQVSANLPSNNSADWYLTNQGLIASLSIDDRLPARSNVTCPGRTLNPIQTIITYLNKLTFIMSDDLYNRPAYRQLINGKNATLEELNQYESSVVQTSEGVQYKAEVHYKTDYGFMYGALVATIVCVILVLPSFWGFWELGRKVSFDPVELAHAFGAPALANTKIIGGHAKEVVSVAGKQHVQYADDDAQGRVFKRVARS